LDHRLSELFEKNLIRISEFPKYAGPSANVSSIVARQKNAGFGVVELESKGNDPFFTIASSSGRAYLNLNPTNRKLFLIPFNILTTNKELAR